ncbi:MAG: DNA recombination protein RmuC, partial [Oscillospiraceae bacterium]
MQLVEILCFAIIALLILVVVLLLTGRKKLDGEKLSRELIAEIRASREETNAAVQNSMRTVGETLSAVQRQATDSQDSRLRELVESVSRSQEMLQRVVTERLGQVEEKFKDFTEQDKQSMESIRMTVQTRLEAMQQDNTKQLDRMRETVDEKLQKTLEERITQSFKLVNERLQEVYTGLGEMKTLASGVGDLKKVLSNVKTRGILGEIQLGAIIEEILPKEQYEENVITKPGSQNRVEFAIRLPGSDEGALYLPVDAKFPADIYNQLVDAYDVGDPAQIAAAASLLDQRIKGCAKDIHDKYIDPPHTTDFAIMFLPFEGLYAEVVRRGLADVVQSQYKISIAGPTTFAALLNSLQMGFRTLAIQKRSSEVWNVLGAVKTEFSTFGTVLEQAQKRIEQTSAELDKLVGVRTRKINSRLRSVSELPTCDAQPLIDSADV